jgi:cytochrome c2
VKQWRSLLGFAVKMVASALAAVLAVVITDAVATRVNPDLKPTRFDVVRGAQIFKSRCFVCHGDEESNLGRMGPNLRNIGTVAATRKPELSAVEYILESIMEPAAFRAPAPTNTVMMPMYLIADLSDDDLRHLIARVASLGARVDDEIAALVIEHPAITATQKVEVRRDVMALGERIFREKCLDCHALHNGAEYSVFAPVVFGVGFSTDRRLEDAIMHANQPGNESGNERYRFTSVALADGTELVGNVLEKTSDELVLLSMRAEDRGAIHGVKLGDIRTGADGSPIVADLETPRMLADVSEMLTPEDVAALVALLEALN